MELGSVTHVFISFYFSHFEKLLPIPWDKLKGMSLNFYSFGEKDLFIITFISQKHLWGLLLLVLTFQPWKNIIKGFRFKK
jgi:hypothetical protein